MGFTHEAKEVAERILETAKSKREQIGCIRLLFNLEQNSDPGSARLLALAEQMGRLVDRDDEVEEGVYLVMMLTGTSMADVSPTSGQVKEFQARAASFFTRWPDSKIIRQVQIRNDASADELLASLNKLVGDDQERTKFRRKLENQLQSGTQAVPFAWRPKLALPNVHDVVHLWEISKTSHGDDRKYHLTMAGRDWQPMPLSKLRELVPLLDLTALLVLDDLELIDRLFEVFPRVAVAQGTLEHPTSLTQVFSGSPVSWRCGRLQANLKRHVDRIEQPSAEVADTDNRLGDDSAEIAALCQTGKYRLYSDDLVFRIYVAAGKPMESMCTCDLLVAPDEAALMDISQVAQKYALLCQWHVGLSIQLRHQLGVLPDGLRHARSVHDGVELLMADKASYSIATAVWDFKGDFNAQLSHVSAVVRELVQQAQLSSVLIAAYVGVWFLKAKLRADVKWPPDAMLVGIAVLAAGNGPALTDDAMRKLWAVYLDLVSFHFGERMDEAKEREAVNRLAEHAARTDSGTGSDQLRVRLAAGLTQGTAPSDRFQSAYSTERVRVDVEAAKNNVGYAHCRSVGLRATAAIQIGSLPRRSP